MKKVKGIVMRNSGKQTVIVTSEGDFLEVPTPPGKSTVGQMIEVTLAPQKSFYKRSVLKYAATAAILILILTMQLFNPLFGPGAAVAYVALDIHKGVELYVDKEGKVSDVRAVSGDANDLLGGLELQGRDIYEAVGLILQKAGAGGILNKDQNLVLASVVPTSDRDLKTVNEDKLRSAIQEAMLGKKVLGYIMVGRVDWDIKQRAENYGMSVNNYLVYDRCRKEGLNIRAEAFRGGDIGKVLSEANTSLHGLFPAQCFEVGRHGKVTPGSERGPDSVQEPNMEQERAQKGSNAGHETGGPGSHQGMPAEQEDGINYSSGWGKQGQNSSPGGAMGEVGQNQYGRD